MAEALILEFDGVDRAVYDEVNRLLEIDVAGGQDGWPAGLKFHCGAAKAGGWVVFELWESKDDQERFMNERLGRALQESGVTEPPTRVEWLEVGGAQGSLAD